MRILFLNQFEFTFLGGVEFHIRSLGRRLIHEGHSVTLVCDKRGTDEGDRFVDGIRVAGVEGIRGLWGFFASNASRFDVCHAHMSRKPFSLAGLVFAKQSGLPTVFTPHCFYPAPNCINGLLKWIYDQLGTRATFHFADRVINLTPKDQDDCVIRGMSIHKSQIIPNSIDYGSLTAAATIDFRANYSVQKEYLLHIGRFQAHKCIDFLVRQHLGLRQHYDLVLIGQDDGEKARIEELVKILGLSSSVHLYSGLSFSDICSAYAQARLFVMASRNEGLPTVVLEAMAFGVPVVAPAVGGIPFIIKHEENGFVYPWADSASYLDCVKKALSFGSEIGDRARACLYQQFSWEQNCLKIAKLYRDLIGPAQDERVESRLVASPGKGGI